jgi:DNA-binding MarR family transcriptional regulator
MQKEGNPIEDRVLVAIRRIIRAIDLHSRHLLEECGLTGPQLAALQTLHREGVKSGVELARELQVGQATVSGIVDRLEKKGLVTRGKNCDDRRLIGIALTPEGKQLVEKAPPLLQERFRRELAGLQEWEQTMILSTLQRIASMMDADEVSAAPYLVTGPERL